MKKLSILLLAVTLYSCSNNDDVKLPTKNGDITGKWYYKQLLVGGAVIPYDGHEECGKDYIEFYDTNKIKRVDISDCEEDVFWIGTFTKESDVLTITLNDNSNTVTITELSEHILSYQYEGDEDGNGTNEVYIATFER